MSWSPKILKIDGGLGVGSGLVLRGGGEEEGAGGEVGRSGRDDGRAERRRSVLAGGRLGQVAVDRLAPVDAVVFGEDAQQRAKLQPPLITRQLVT